MAWSMSKNSFVVRPYDMRGITFAISSTFASMVALLHMNLLMLASRVGKLLVPCSWSTPDASATLWATEPVVSNVIIPGSNIDAATAKEDFFKDLDAIDLLTTTHIPSITGNQVMGRWAGRLVWRQVQFEGYGNPYVP
ncbi:hypothetical protein DL768_010485 [Monosporascus sp. mg162]|nr:hypothetical protein DL768_010485 [Monosporascus sp. mg162]